MYKKKFLSYRFNISLGFEVFPMNFFKVKGLKQYNKHISICTKNFTVMRGIENIKVIENLIFFIKNFITKQNLFLFVSIYRDHFIAKKLYKFIQSKIYNYFIYDWIFGLMGNYKRVFKRANISYKKIKLYLKKPDIAFLFDCSFWTKEILFEIKFKNILSFGTVEANFIKNVDYPLPYPNCFESGLYVIYYILSIIKKEFIENLYLYIYYGRNENIFKKKKTFEFNKKNRILLKSLWNTLNNV